MATEVKSKPNLMLIAAIAGLLLIANGQGWINVGPAPTPVIKPEPSPIPNPNPNPVPVPTPTPDPTPEPVIVNEEFPELPAAYAAVSVPINSSLFKKETKEDALNYARFYRDSANALRVDPSITSNSQFIRVYTQALQSLANAFPGMAQRNPGLGKAIDDVLATQGLDLANWTEENRKNMASAMDAVSNRCLEAFQTLNK